MLQGAVVDETAFSLMALMERHASLDGLFLEHQTALLERDFDGAVGAFERYVAVLEAHVEEEQRTILPLYREKAAQPPGGTAGMFEDEHRKIRDMIADLRGKLENARDAASGRRPDARIVLALLDQETQFKNFMDHHDRRERTFLYPGLDAVTTPEERREILRSLGITHEA